MVLDSLAIYRPYWWDYLNSMVRFCHGEFLVLKLSSDISEAEIPLVFL